MRKLMAILLCILAASLLTSCGVNTKDTQGIAGTTDEALSQTDITETQSPDADGASATEEKRVVAVVMGRERIPEISGKYNTWSNSGKELAHTPDKADENGRRDIASVYYPSIGLYDVTDPDYQEYMMQLCKMSYIDTLNYYITDADSLESGHWWGDGFDKTTAPLLRKYGLNSIARLASLDGEASALKNTFTNIIKKLDDTILKINGRPVLSQFSVSGLTPDIFDSWKNEYFAENGVVPFLMLREANGHLSDKWNQTVDGYYGWTERVEYDKNVDDYETYVTAEQAKRNHDSRINLVKDLMEQGKVTYFAEGLCPGFDDIAVWGWSTVPEKIERGENAEVYEYKWQAAVKNSFPMVVIPTWDDWGEATTIEPTLEYGIDYLEITRKYAAEYKGIEANTASLELPGWIYKIRKTTSDKAILKAMDEASQLIAEELFDEAEAIVTPYVTSLSIPATSKEFFKYPTTPTVPIVSEAVSPIPTQGAHGEEIFMPVADTYIKISSGKSADAGLEKELIVKKADSTNLTRQIYIKFDTAKTGMTSVKKATLRLYCSYANTNKDEIAGRDINIYASDFNWKELSFSTASKPALKEKLADLDNIDFKKETWIEIDVTDYVKSHLGEAFSFAILNEGLDSKNNHIKFHSREATAYKPELVIE